MISLSIFFLTVAGGLDYELTEGDIISVFSQYGEPVDINLKRDKVCMIRYTMVHRRYIDPFK